MAVRIVFFGTGDFAVPALRRIHRSVILVVTQPDRPSGRGLNLRASPIRLAALELGLEVLTPERSRSPEFLAELERRQPDALVVASYGQIVSQAVLDSAQRGGFNLHGSILPFYRGAAPIQRAILDGVAETGVTLMQMDRGMDTGDIIDIVRTPVGPNETYGELQDRLADLAAQQLEDWLPRLASGDYPRSPQDSRQATMAPKVEKQEAELRWDRDARQEFNRFRAFTPNPGSFFRIEIEPEGVSSLVRVWKAAFEPASAPAGTLWQTNPFPCVAFANGSLSLIEVQPEGKKRMSGRDWVNGLRLRPGHVFLHGKSTPL